MNTVTIQSKQRTCDELSEAINNGKMGDIVSKHEKVDRAQNLVGTALRAQLVAQILWYFRVHSS